MTIKEVCFIADLEILQAIAEGLGGKGGLFGGAGRSVSAHADAVDAGPTGGLQEPGEVADGVGGDGVVAGLGLSHDFANGRMIRLGGIGGGLPVSELAGV